MLYSLKIEGKTLKTGFKTSSEPISRLPGGSSHLRAAVVAVALQFAAEAVGRAATRFVGSVN